MTKPRYAIIPAGAVVDPDLEGNDLRVLCYLGTHTDKLGWCFLKQASIAGKLGIGRSTVQRSLARLVTAGWVQIKTAGEGARPHACHAYRVIMDRDDIDFDPSEFAVEEPETPERCPPVGTSTGEVPAHDGHLGAHVYMGTERPFLNDLDDDGGVARASVLTDECFEIARTIGKLCGYAEPIDWPPKWSQSHYRVQTWVTAGWSRENIIAGVTEAMASKRDGPPSSINYFDKPIAQFIARREQPLPKVIQRSQEIINAKTPQHRTGSGWQGRRDAFADAHAKLREHNQGQSAPAGSQTTSGETVQLAAPTGRAGP